jgi:hypothetical protein
MAGYLQELSEARSMLGRRYDELKSGCVKPLDGEQAFAALKTEERRTPAFMKKFALHPETYSDLSEVWVVRRSR